MIKSYTHDNLFYVMAILLNMDFRRGLFILYLLQVGLSHGEIGILQSVLFFTNVLFEVPSGYLADRFGRRQNIMFTFIFLAINAIGFLIFTDFIPFLLLTIAYGIGMALSSGTDRAWLYDNLKYQSRTTEFKTIIAKMRAVYAVSLGVSMFVGGALQYHISWESVYIAFAISKIIGGIWVIFMPEFKILTTHTETSPIGSDTHDMGANTTKKPNLIAIIKSFFRTKIGLSLIPIFLGFAFFDTSLTIVYIYAQEFFANRSVDTLTIGGIYAGIELITACMYIVVSKSTISWSFKTITCVTCLIISVLLLGLYFAQSVWLMIVIFFVIMGIPAFYDVAYDTYINDKIPSEIRATCLSMGNLINSLIIGVSYVVYGVVIQFYSINTGILLSAILCFIAVWINAMTHEVRKYN